MGAVKEKWCQGNKDKENETIENRKHIGLKKTKTCVQFEYLFHLQKQQKL